VATVQQSAFSDVPPEKLGRFQTGDSGGLFAVCTPTRVTEAALWKPRSQSVCELRRLRHLSPTSRNMHMTVAPKWFKPVAIVALLWNLMGCVALISDLSLTPSDIAKLSVAEQAMYAARPAWAVGATGLGVIAGALGCVGLLLGKRWSLPLFVVSLLGVIAQDVFMFGGSAPIDSTAVILQGMVLVIAVALVLLARKAIGKGWLV
jgi:hypothetical protein